jgi:hypothetical protein
MKRDDDHYGARKPAPVTDLPLFGGTPEPEPVVPPAPVEDRRRKVRAIHDAGARRWIEAGKPIALLVAAQDGQVTAETFRAAAEKLPHALPPGYGDQRALSWIPAMFAELCRDGHIEKARHPNGATVKVYSKETGNAHAVYRLTAAIGRAG